MPWTSKEASGFTKSANTATKRKRWRKIANAALKSGKSEASAIRIANSSIGDSLMLEPEEQEFIDRFKKITERDPFGRVKSIYEEEEDDPESYELGKLQIEAKKRARDSAIEVLATESKDMNFCDRLELDDAAKLRFTQDGYMAAMPRIARTGIQLYHGSECGRPDIDTVRVYRPHDSVFAPDAIRSLAHRPVTIEHPPERVTADNWKSYAVGHTGDEPLRDGEAVRVPMVLMDSAAIKEFKAGKKELSVGYTCDLDWKEGVTADGQKYDAVQKNIRANHLAVVAAARGGASLAIGDDRKEPAMELKTVVVDGISCQMTDTAVQVVQKALDKYREATDAWKKKFEEDEEEKKKNDSKFKDAIIEAKKQLDAKDGELAVLKQQLADAQNPEKIDAAIKAKQAVIDKAKPLLGDKLVIDGKSPADIRRQVVMAKMENAKDWSDDTITGAFSALTADIKPQPTTTGSSFTDAVRSFAQPTFDQTDPKAKAWMDMVKDQADAWKKGKTA